ncbi:MAG TPA: methylenetetrahydrofolate reductase [Clostridia bacterium]|nr:methylenetetrahydrofolate reductase [Clostridia bacterium]
MSEENGNRSGLKTDSRIEKLLSQGHFVVTAEIGPPKSASPKGIIKNATLLKDAVDGMNLTDNQTAIVRLSSIAAAVHVMSAGGEPIIQMTCRDRNRIALQSDLLGAASLGIKNVLCLSGDHQSFGNHVTAKNVYDIDSIQLVSMVKTMRDEKKFLCGEEMKVEPRMFIGAAANPFADPFEFRVVRLAKKVAAGADFIQTQAIFDIERFKRWMAMVRDQGLHEKVAILGGVLPAKSFGAMKYMKDVPGMSIPEDLLKRMKGTPKEKQPEEGIKICAELIQMIREVPGVRGVHIMAVMWEETVPEIVKMAGLLPRPSVA